MAYLYIESDHMLGTVGDDTFDGRTPFGVNHPVLLLGGGGNDLYIIHAGMLVDESYGGGIDSVLLIGGSTYALPAGVENLAVATEEYGGDVSGVTLIGNGADNVISGSDRRGDLILGNDWIDGGLGADTMAGGTGSDTYVVDNAGDRIIEAATPAGGADSIYRDVVHALVSHTLGANVEDLVLLETVSATTGTGNASANTITGNAHANVLQGAGGNDELDGNEGDDLLEGGEGNDDLDGGAGTDRLRGGGGNDTYRLSGEDAADIVEELAGGGDDSVRTQLDAYTLTANVENLFFEGAGVSTGTGNASANFIEGGLDGDTLAGLGGDDVLSGGPGGEDRLLGGAGNDSYRVDYDDTVVEAANEGVDWVLALLSPAAINSAEHSYALPDHVENLRIETRSTFMQTFGGDAYGNALNNVIVGNVLDNRLEGRGGDDTLDGRGGNDIYSGGTGNDTFIVDSGADFATVLERAGEGVDTVRVRGNLYNLWGNVENVVQTDTDAGYFHHLNGNELDNRLEGNAGTDWFEASAGNDTMVGRGGNDDYHVQQAGDVVVEAANEGVDRIRSDITITALAANVENLELLPFAGTINGTGNALDNLIAGNSANNILNGGAGNDHLEGNGGDDTLIGGAGDDTLGGGFGADVLNGGAGNDTYYADGDDTVVADAAGIDKVFLYGQPFPAAPGLNAWAAPGGFTMAAGIENLEMLGGHGYRVTGNALANEIIGNARGNLISGDAGNDVIDGRGGADTMIGGLGNDAYFIDQTGDVIVENAGGGTDTVNVDMRSPGGSAPAPLGMSLDANIENLNLLEGTTVASVNGNELANVLTGNSRGNELRGRAGNDTLVGGAGDDTLDGADVETLGAVNSGIDTLRGGTGNDTYYVDFTGATADLVVENAAEGIDIVNVYEYDAGPPVAYVLPVNVEAVIVGQDGGPSRVSSVTGNASDNLVASVGNQALNGAAGNDILLGVEGNNVMTGGAGNDTFYVESGDGAGVAIGGVNEDRIVEGVNAGIDTAIITADLAAYGLEANVENLVLAGAGEVDLGGFGVTYGYSGLTMAGGTFSGNALNNLIQVETTVAVAVNAGGGDDTVERLDTLLVAGDTFNGGAGRDTLSVAFSGSVTGASAAGFEIINLRPQGTGDSAWAGIGAADSPATAMVLNIQGDGPFLPEGSIELFNLPGNLLLAGSRINIIDYRESMPGGPSRVELDFGGASAGANALNVGLANVDAALAVAGIETLNIISDAAINFLDVGNVEGEQRINVSGTGSLQLENVEDGSTIGLDHFSGGRLRLFADDQHGKVTVQVGAVEATVAMEGFDQLTLVQATGVNPANPIGDSVITVEGESAASTLSLVVEAGATLHVDDVNAAVVDLGGVDGLLFVNAFNFVSPMLFDASDFDNAQTSHRAMILNTGGETDTFDFTDGVPRYLFINDGAFGDGDVLNADITGANRLQGPFDGTAGTGHAGAPFVSNVEHVNLSVARGSTSNLDAMNIFTPEMNVASTGPASPDATVLSLYAVNASVFDASGFDATVAGSHLEVSFFSPVNAVGSAGDDQLIAISGGDDRIRGGQGNDLLFGNDGADSFVYSESGASNADTILDFSAGLDQILLDRGTFTQLGASVSSANLRSGAGASAQDANDYLVFDTDTGSLYYDADGSGAGARQEIVTVGPGVVLAAADIVTFFA